MSLNFSAEELLVADTELLPDPDAPIRRRGLRKGQTHSGSFKPGNDPRRNNAGPRSRVNAAIEERARESTDDAISLLETVMNDKKQPVRLRVICAESLLNRGHGTPISRQHVLSASVEADKTRNTAISAMTEQDLLTLLQGPETDQNDAGDASFSVAFPSDNERPLEIGINTVPMMGVAHPQELDE